MDLYPHDVPNTRTLYPCNTIADVNCLSSTGSIFAFGEPEHISEMRVRILLELVLQKNMYLDNEFLSKGYGLESKKNFTKLYAQYSDMYVPGMLLDERTIEFIFKMETTKNRIDKFYMGQVRDFSSVLRVRQYPLFTQNLEIQMSYWI